MKINLENLKNHYINNSVVKPANKSANNVVINVIDFVANSLKNGYEKEIIINDISSNGLISRGVAVECLIKMLYTNRTHTHKAEKGADFTSKGVKYEVKCSTSKGYAHYNPSQDLHNLIFVNSQGIYYIENGANNIILDKCGKHIQDIKINKNVEVIKEW